MQGILLALKKKIKKYRIGDHRKTANCRTGICNSAGLVSEMGGHTLESGVLLFENLLNAFFFAFLSNFARKQEEKCWNLGAVLIQ